MSRHADWRSRVEADREVRVLPARVLQAQVSKAKYLLLSFFTGPQKIQEM
jgi:BRCT domain type II-containing protein